MASINYCVALFLLYYSSKMINCDTISTAYFTSNYAVGGPNGNFFSFNAGNPFESKSKSVIQLIQAWYSSKNAMVRGLLLETNDGLQAMLGSKTDEPAQPIYIYPGELITSLELYYSPYAPTKTDKGRCGGFQMKTSTGKVYTVGSGDPSYSTDIGSGILVGAFGHSGLDIDCLNFALLREVKSAQIIKVTYPKLGYEELALQPRAINSIEYDNTDGDEKQSFVVSGSETIEISQEWSVSEGIESGVSIEVTASIPFLDKASMKAQVQMEDQSSYKRSQTITKTWSYEMPINVPAGQHIQVTALLRKGNINLDYQGTMQFVLDTNKQYSYVIHGNYTGVLATDIELKTTKIKPTNQ